MTQAVSSAGLAAQQHHCRQNPETKNAKRDHGPTDRSEVLGC